MISWLGRIKIPDIGAIGGLLGGAPRPPRNRQDRGDGIGLVSGRASTAVPLTANVGVGVAGGTVINIMGGLESADTIAHPIPFLTAREPSEADHDQQGTRDEQAGVGIRVLLDGKRLDDGCIPRRRSIRTIPITWDRVSRWRRDWR